MHLQCQSCKVLAAAMEQQGNSGSSSPYVPLERAAHSDLERRAANLELESQSSPPQISQSQASGTRVAITLTYEVTNDCIFV